MANDSAGYRDFLRLYEKQSGLTQQGEQDTMEGYEDFGFDVVRVRTR